MKTILALSLVVALTPLPAFAANNDGPILNGVSGKSERAMAPNSPETGATAAKTETGRSADSPSERAMDPAKTKEK